MKHTLRRILRIGLPLLVLAAHPLSALDAALERHAEGDFDGAVALLAQRETQLGRPTPRVESLRVHVHVARADWSAARVALTRYLQLAGPSASGPAHAALVALGPEIDRRLAAADAAWRREREEGAAAELDAIASRQLAERRERREALRLQGASLAPLLASGRARPDSPDFVVSVPPIRPGEITDAQVADLASDFGELAGWLELNAASSSPDDLALKRRLMSTFAAHIHDPAPKPPVLLGEKIIAGLSPASGPSPVHVHVPVERMAAAAGKPAVLDLYQAADRWMISPAEWTSHPRALVHYHIVDSINPEHDIAHNIAQGHVLTGLTYDGEYSYASFLVQPLRQTRSRPDYLADIRAGNLKNPPHPGPQKIIRSRLFPAAELAEQLRRGNRLVNLDWGLINWIAIVALDDTAFPRRAEPEVWQLLPDHGLLHAPTAADLLDQIAKLPAGVAAIKVVGGRDHWAALTRKVVAPPTLWLVVDGLDDPTLSLFESAGLQIRLLAGPSRVTR